jgi:hypothetical protein
MAWRGLNAGSYTPLPRLVCPQPRLSGRQSRGCPVLSSRPPRQTEKAAKCPEPLCPTRALPPLGCARACFFHGVIGLPQRKSGSASRSIPLETTSCGGTFEVTDISLCSGLQVCSPPRSSLPLRILPQGGRGFYVRAERGSLPPRASDMLTARRQAIGGTGTCTPLDCGLVGCSFPLAGRCCMNWLSDGRAGSRG